MSVPLLENASRRRAAVAFAALTAATFVLIVFGATVRANGAGLACPDWPLCFGAVVPSFDFQIALEWGHRVLAGSVALGLLATTLWMSRTPALLRSVARPLAAAWILLVVQVVLGGLTVLLGLAPWTVVAHLLAGNAFGACLLWCACDLGARRGERAALTPLARGLALATGGGVVVQLVLGGLVSSHYAGLACHTFPTCDGVDLAPTLNGLVGLHVLHRFGGYAVAAAFALLAWATRATPGPLASYAWGGLRLVVLQVAVGVANVLFRLPVELTALHTAIAAALVLLTALMVREVWIARAESVGSPGARVEVLGTP